MLLHLGDFELFISAMYSNSRERLEQSPWSATTSESPIPLGILSLLCWQSCLYWSWSERNFRLHRQTFRPPSSLIRQIDRQIKDRILSLRTSNPAVSSIMMQRWLAWWASRTESPSPFSLLPMFLLGPFRAFYNSWFGSLNGLFFLKNWAAV